MWDDKKCLTALQMLDIPEAKALAFDFATEILGMIRSDLCRLVMLYSSGGYYFDTDIVLLASMEKRIHPEATFVTVRAVERYGGGFFQAFLATTPKHPLIERSLKNLTLAIYHSWNGLLTLANVPCFFIWDRKVGKGSILFAYGPMWSHTHIHNCNVCILFQNILRSLALAPLFLRKFKAWYDIYWAPGQDQTQLRKDTAHGTWPFV